MPSATGYRAEEILDSSTSFYRVSISNLMPTKMSVWFLKSLDPELEKSCMCQDQIPRFLLCHYPIDGHVYLLCLPLIRMCGLLDE